MGAQLPKIHGRRVTDTLRRAPLYSVESEGRGREGEGKGKREKRRGREGEGRGREGE